MRVIAGKFKGRRLSGSPDSLFRPTLDRVKESIFNVLGNVLVDSYVLDLFCGCGSLGIEALSRGAIRSTFIDSNKKILGVARKNIKSLDIEHKAKIILADVFRFLEDHAGLRFDIILADPPYEKRYGTSICEHIIRYDILGASGLLVLERFKKENPEHDALKLIKRLKFGQTEVDFYKRED